MRKSIIIQTLAASVSLVVFSVGCSTNNNVAPPMAEKTRASASSAPVAAPVTQQQSPQTRNEHIVHESAELSSDNKAELYAPKRLSAPAVQNQLLADSGINDSKPVDPMPAIIENRENYAVLSSNPVIQVADQSTSTFSIDVDTGAYANVRRFLNAGQLPPTDAVRLEEMLNYFNYDYATPTSTETPFSIYTELASTPWNEKTRLLHIGLKGYTVNADERPAANLVFLLDVSGSMKDRNKLGLLKASINMLTNDLTEKDSVSIVVYAGASGVVLEPTAGNNRHAIKRALKSLQAGGSTNGEAGIELAYAMAEKTMTKDSINRIILATDGDFNVGISNIDTLKKLIEQKRRSGIALTTLGFGQGNYNDHLMEQLANVGNGNYAYIDTLNEARKVLSEELTATLLTIAKDVKIQIEFNPEQVSEYRLIGYVNRHLANEDFANDKVDAGEIGAGHTVTALYEIALTGEGGEWNTRSRYKKAAPNTAMLNEIAELRLRYKKPDENTSTLISRVLNRDSLISEFSKTSDNFRFSAAVAGFGQLLRHNKFLGDFNYTQAAKLAAGAKGVDRFGYRAELVQMIDLANELDQQNQANVADESTTENSEG